MNLIRHTILMLAMVCSFVAGAAAADSITTEGVVSAPVGDVSSAFDTSQGLRSWMAPHADIDLRVDGLMRVNYKPEGTLGDGSTVVNRVLSFEPQHLLSMRVAKAPDDFPFPGAIVAMWTVRLLRGCGRFENAPAGGEHGLYARCRLAADEGLLRAGKRLHRDEAAGEDRQVTMRTLARTSVAPRGARS